MAILKTEDHIPLLKQSGLILASCHFHLKNMLKPGISAKELDDFANEFIKDNGGVPSFTGYQNYRFSLCVSVNNEVVHGLPLKNKIIPENGLVGLDLGVNYKGLFTDSAFTHIIGQVDQRSQKLIEVTQYALKKAIGVVKDGARVGDIGYAVDLEAKKNGFGNVLDLGGHGLGYSVHDDPYIMHAGRSGKGPRLFENQVIAIEPMFTLGSGEVDFDESPADGWTVRTKDNTWAAQFEHTLLVTKKGCEVITDISEEKLIK